MVVATDTDVLVLAIAMSVELPGVELWLAFGHGKNFRYIPAHQIAYNLGMSNSNGILFFHDYTGCDTVSFFSGVGKKTAFNVWKSYPHF